MTGCIRLPVAADIGYEKTVLDDRGFRHIGEIAAFNGRGRLIMRTHRVQTGWTDWGMTWDFGERLEVVEGARIVDEGNA